MDGFSLAKKQRRPSDTFCAGEIPRDQLANLANFTSSIGKEKKCKPASLKKCCPFADISLINQG